MNEKFLLETRNPVAQMLAANKILETPWDSKILGVLTYEIKELQREVLNVAAETPGHYTVKINPLTDKRLLHEYGFYYCDTLMEPHCTRDRFVHFARDDVTLSSKPSLADLLAICHGAFKHGRFHRDFNITKVLADLRYDRWLEQLYKAGNVLGLVFENTLIGFIAVSENKLILHAIAPEYRGKGLAKYLWSAACVELFDRGHVELLSSVSAANLPVVNLYTSLGFRFRNAVDVYHLVVS